MKKELWTGERLETYIFNTNTIEHLHRYALAIELCKGKDVLDIACGEGYGSNLLAKVSNIVVGVDISEETIANAKLRYTNSNLSFLFGRADNIPCKDNSFDVVVSFETIEHHDRHNEMLLEIKRVLRPNGILIISSPDKKYYSDIPNYNNPFHVKELYEHELRNLIQRHFKHYSFSSQRAGYFSVILQEDQPALMKSYEGDFNNINRSPNWGTMYWIVIASDQLLPKIEYAPLFQGDIVLKHIVKEAEQKIKRSKPYRLGEFIFRPIFKILRFINGK